MPTYELDSPSHMGSLAGETLTAALLNAHVRDNLNAAFPVGSIHYFMQAGTSTETFINAFALEMNGVNVSRTTYSSLNTLLGGLTYPFGTGDGSTTMGLPDAKGRALYHAASGGNADVNGLGDSDALSVASRSPKHNSTFSQTVSASAIASALTATSTQPNGAAFVHDGSGALVGAGAQGGQSVALVGSGTVAVAGTIGVGGTRPNDLTPWLVAGVYAVKT